LIHLVDRSDSLSITDAADQLITWFSWTAWSVSADLLDSADEVERWLLVKARFFFDSTSDLCSCNLTPSFLPVSPMLVFSQLAHGTLHTHSVVCSLSSRSLGCTKTFLRVTHGFIAQGTLCFFHDPGYCLWNFLYIGNHHRSGIVIC